MIQENNYENWLSQVERIRSKGLPADIEQDFLGRKISSLSQSLKHSCIQVPRKHGCEFEVIQNHSEITSARMDAWLMRSDVGLRFATLKQLLEQFSESSFTNRSLYVGNSFELEITSSNITHLEKVLASGNSVSLGWSPLAFGLSRGEILKRPYKFIEPSLKFESLKHDGCRWFHLSSAPYEWAGASPDMELGVMLSLYVEVYEWLADKGFSHDLIMSKIDLCLSLTQDVPKSAAKLIALKLLVRKVCQQFSNQKDANSAVYAMPSLRCYSGRDPLNNLLRFTLMSFAAMVGGAQGMKCIPYDILSEKKSTDSVRSSLNVPILLKEESNIDACLNPLDGSSIYSDLASSLAEKSWSYFCDLQKQGGLTESIRSGWIQDELSRSQKKNQRDIIVGRKHIVGCTKFAVFEDKLLGDYGAPLELRKAIDSSSLTREEHEVMSIKPVLTESDSYFLENLQSLATSYSRHKGHSPCLKVYTEGAKGSVASFLSAEFKNMGFVLDSISLEELGGLSTAQPLMILGRGEMGDEAFKHHMSSLGLRNIWSYKIAGVGEEFEYGLELVEPLTRLFMKGGIYAV